jgi:heme-degrading monooxygenase HmoA
MFARNVSARLKPNSITQFTETFDKEVVPMLRKQPGFRDEITLASEDGLHVTAISIWDTKEQAEAYNTAGYPEVLKTLDKVLDGAPKVRLSKIASSTVHQPAAVAAA